MKGMISFAIAVLLCGISLAEIPQVISYQGKVTDAAGNPVADGSYTMRFRIYNAVTGGTSLWDSGVRTVSIAGGVFSVLLGESPQPALGLYFNADYWLLVTFNGVDQTPRQRMTSSGYAYMASGLVPGTEVSGSITSGTNAAITGTNAATTSMTYGVFGRTNSTADGAGVYGVSASTAVPMLGGAAGVLGTCNHGYAYGVSGINYGDGGLGCGGHFAGITGIHAEGSLKGIQADGVEYGVVAVGSYFGVKGTGEDYGVVGQSLWEDGGWGVYGENYSTTAGGGVYGYARANTGATFGVLGETHSSGGQGVRGVNLATTGYTGAIHGLAMSSGGRGVTGECNGTAGIGVVGWAGATTGSTNGVFGYSASPTGAGVVGQAATTTGSAHGVYGASSATGGSGVTGIATATTGANYGVYGRSDSTLGKGVYYQGGLAGSGTKSCVVRTSKGPTLMYCQESPENWFEDFGEGRLVNGHCHVELDPVFLETVTIDAANPMKVFVQLENEASAGLRIKRGSTGFDVENGALNTVFWYRVVAKRQGFEAKRLDVCEAARTDSYLYPELREKEQAELEAERVRHDEERTRREEERVRMSLP